MIFKYAKSLLISGLFWAACFSGIPGFMNVFRAYLALIGITTFLMMIRSKEELHRILTPPKQFMPDWWVIVTTVYRIGLMAWMGWWWWTALVLICDVVYLGVREEQKERALEQTRIPL